MMCAINAVENVDVKTTIDCLLKLGNVVSIMNEHLMQLGKFAFSTNADGRAY